MLNIKLLSGLFGTALNEAIQSIKPQAAKPEFYCDSLGVFTGADGRDYVVEITVRPASD